MFQYVKVCPKQSGSAGPSGLSPHRGGSPPASPPVAGDPLRPLPPSRGEIERGAPAAAHAPNPPVAPPQWGGGQKSPHAGGLSVRNRPPSQGGCLRKQTGGSVRRTEHSTTAAPTPPPRGAAAPLHRGAIPESSYLVGCGRKCSNMSRFVQNSQGRQDPPASPPIAADPLRPLPPSRRIPSGLSPHRGGSPPASPPIAADPLRPLPPSRGIPSGLSPRRGGSPPASPPVAGGD